MSVARNDQNEKAKSPQSPQKSSTGHLLAVKMDTLMPPSNASLSMSTPTTPATLHRRTHSFDSHFNCNSQETSTAPKTSVSIHIETEERYSLDALLLANNESSAVSTNTSYSSRFFTPIVNSVSQYQSLYNVFINSKVKNTMETQYYQDIKSSDMLGTDWTEIDDEQFYHVGFARKTCIEKPISILHASLCFKEVSSEGDGKFLIVGRQNAQFKKKNPLDDSQVFSWWVLSHLNLSTLYYFTTTEMGNEKKYDFFPGSLFNAEMSDVILSGAEIKKIVAAVNDDVCSHRYDVIHSNCYSAVLYGLSKVFDLINDTITSDRHGQQEALKSIFTLIRSALQDNYKLGLGGMDNEYVAPALEGIVKTLLHKNILQVSKAQLNVPTIAISYS